jgi:hypothetical protein
MISFNDIIKISTLYNNKQNDKLLKIFTSKFSYTNILELLHKIKEERFPNDTAAIKLKTDDKELIIYKKSFFPELPEYSEEEIILPNDTIVTIGYPIGNFFSNAAFIKKIQINNIIFEINESNYQDIPISVLNNCNDHIKKYLDKLNNISLYHINEQYNCGFMYCEEIIIHIIYLCFVYDEDILLEEQMCLLKNGGFNYTDFDVISYDQYKKYAKIFMKISKKEQAQYKQK